MDQKCLINLVETFNCYEQLSEMGILDLGSAGSNLQAWYQISEFVFELDFVAHFKWKHKPRVNRDTLKIESSGIIYGSF